jgi:xylulokinase
LADIAADIPPGAEGLFFLPHLAGERTPHMDPEARGAFIGLTLRHQRGHLVRAVMEGVVLTLRQGFELMIGLGVPVDRVVASGGGTRHPLWLQLQADILNRPIYQTQTIEAAAVGAALLAGVGAGVYLDARAACRRTVRWRETVVYPIPENVALYDAAYDTYCALYPALKTAGM